MKTFLFNYEGRKYITDAQTQMDAEEMFFQEFGEYNEEVEELDDIDEFLDSDEDVVYF